MNDPSLLVLVSLSDGAKHGYAIQTDVESFSGARLGPGTLYGALSRLERDGLVEALRPEQRRQPYRLSRKGRQELKVRLSKLEAVLARAQRVRPA